MFRKEDLSGILKEAGALSKGPKYLFFLGIFQKEMK